VLIAAMTRWLTSLYHCSTAFGEALGPGRLWRSVCAAASTPSRPAVGGIIAAMVVKSCRHVVAVVGSTYLRARSSLPLSLLPMTGGMRGDSNGLNVHHHGETGTQRTTYSPSWRAKCRRVPTLPPASLLKQPVVVHCSEGLGLSYSQVVRLS
jgi:hypothetical protein